MGISHQGFYPNTPFFQDGGYKTRRIIKYFSKETKKNEFICVKLVVILIFCNEKVPFKIFCQRSK